MFVSRQIFHFQPYCSYSKSSYQNHKHMPLIEIQHHLGDFYRCSKLSSFQVLKWTENSNFLQLVGKGWKLAITSFIWTVLNSKGLLSKIENSFFLFDFVKYFWWWIDLRVLFFKSFFSIIFFHRLHLEYQWRNPCCNFFYFYHLYIKLYKMYVSNFSLESQLQGLLIFCFLIFLLQTSSSEPFC